MGEVRHHCLSRRLQNLFERLKMRVSSIRRGLEFGKLATVRGQTKYHLSPFEQRAFAGAIATGVPNTLWRIRTNIFYWLPPITLAYLIYDPLRRNTTDYNVNNLGNLITNHKLEFVQ